MGDIAKCPKEIKISVAELSAKIGMTDQRIQGMLRRYGVDAVQLMFAMELTENYKRTLHKTCSLLKEHSYEEVVDIFEICNELEDISLISVSMLMRHSSVA